MDGRIPDDVLDAVRTRVSIVDVVGAHVTLRRAGKNWKGLCPFHGEKTPSFVVNEERGTYHCFGCGAGGNAFRFLMEAEGRTFREAVELLAARAGVPLQLGPERPEDRQVREERDILLELLELATRYYRYQLEEGRAGAGARAYLAERGIGPEAAELFRLGCAPPGWDNLARYLRKKGCDPTLAAKAGLLSERTSGGHYDRLRDRLVFPIADPSGRIVSFGGRLLGVGEPKYLNGPETPVFHKSEVLYGLHQGIEVVRRDRRALLVEGYLDVVSLHSHGHRSALATLGTSLTREHVHALRRRVDEVVLVYDGDSAGRRAAFRSLELFLSGGLPCRVVLLPPEHDPDSFVRAGGDLAELVKTAEPLFTAFLESLAAGLEAGGVEGRLAAVDAVVPALKGLEDPLARDLYAREAAERLGVAEDRLRARLAASEPAAGRGSAAAGVSGWEAEDPVERSLVEALIQEPHHRAVFRERGLAEWMRPGLLREAAEFLSGREEAAAVLPLHLAPGPVAAALSPLMVSGAEKRPAFESLEARLRLRGLEGRAAALVQEMRQAEARGDLETLRRLQQEKMAVDREATQSRRRAGA